MKIKVLITIDPDLHSWIKKERLNMSRICNDTIRAYKEQAERLQLKINFYTI